MSEPAENTIWQPSMFSAEDFPVSRTPWLADEKALKTTATSGPSSPDSFASLDPDGSWLKTCQGFCQLMLDGTSERFSETWPRAGMTRNGTAYRQVPSVPLTAGTDSGWWPTPRFEPGNFSRVNGKIYETSLQSMARRGLLWPTPTAEAAKNVPYQKGSGAIRYPMLLGAVSPSRMWPTPSATDGMGGRMHAVDAHLRRKVQIGLNYAAKMWPTVTVQDASNNAGSSQFDRNSLPLNAAVGGSLNPTWVELLMGFPPGWTDLP
jgi:hypothetical protein